MSSEEDRDGAGRWSLRSDVASSAAWIARGRELLSDEEWKGLLRVSPLAAVLRSARRNAPADASTEGIDARDPALVDWVLDFFRAVGERYFRWLVTGLENVPAKGGALLVGNHNGTIITTDSYLTMVAIRDHFGVERALHPLAHDLLFEDPALARLVTRLGVLRAQHEGGLRALREGSLVLVYPGSDLDAARPFRDRHRIELGGRKGFLKLALRAGVPIVPVVSVGTHEQLVVLARGKRLASFLGLRRLRIDVLPVTLSLPWGIGLGMMPYLPLPAQTSIAFGRPIHFEGAGERDADDPEVLDGAYERVERAMQAMLDELSDGRLPFIGKMR